MPTRIPATIAMLLGVIAPGQAALAQEAFRDDFDTFDRGRWMVSDGWTNGPWMNCDWSRDAVRVADGHLRLHARRTAPGIICGEVQSRAEHGYGTYEVRLRSGRGSGLNAAFFTYVGPVHGRDHHEIDIEILTRDTGAVTFNTYVAGAAQSGGRAPLAPPSDAGFRTYAFDWRPDGIAWFVDGALVHRTGAGSPVPEPPQRIYASLWSSDSFPDWMGPFDETALPAVLEIDWIAFTPLGAPCQFPASLRCAVD